MKPSFLLFLLLTSWSALAQSVPPPGEMARTAPAPPSVPASSRPSSPPKEPTDAALARLAQTNQDLVDLLKKQQAVLEDIQVDRRLQNRQIQLIEVRLEETLQTNATLQAKVAKLEAQAQAAASNPAGALPLSKEHAPNAAEPVAATLPAPPPAPATYLPAPESAGAPGTLWWHRLLTLSGNDTKNSPDFHVQGKQWRVVWHNEDRPGDAYKNTSALFVSAFPKNDALPKKVCSKLGSGSDSTELTGAGDYYLKIEASGGHWELAVEDFR